MSRYIDADNIEFFECRVPTICKPNKYSEEIIITKSIGIFAKKEQIDQIPSADVEPVRHGRWFAGTLDDDWDCSCCNRRIFHFGIPSEKYCPHCGAKMDGKET